MTDRPYETVTLRLAPAAVDTFRRAAGGTSTAEGLMAFALHSTAAAIRLRGPERVLGSLKALADARRIAGDAADAVASGRSVIAGVGDLVRRFFGDRT